ncbi:MAG: hypothetical protein OCU20_03770 [Methanophagales archaeon]|nr:hypothetical protein [Methanophagales archaeon]MCW3140436.1 hypothetical protein [Methanophagales archaeon]MCW7069542.1 hypothetical protein [Methanophagales archaeon]MCW7073000.1 hypothetical protein [Methanophagales archaeon]
MSISTDGDKMADDEREKETETDDRDVIELIASVQRAGEERGKRIYFDSKSMEKIREKCGDDFFLFTERTLLAFIDPVGEKITLTPLKGVYKKFL